MSNVFAFPSYVEQRPEGLFLDGTALVDGDVIELLDGGTWMLGEVRVTAKRTPMFWAYEYSFAGPLKRGERAHRVRRGYRVHSTVVTHRSRSVIDRFGAVAPEEPRSKLFD